MGWAKSNERNGPIQTSEHTELRRRGIHGYDEPIVYKGEVVGTVKKYSDACLIFYLKGRRGDVFRERTELSGPGGGPITSVDLARLTTEQLQTMRDWLEGARDGGAGVGASRNGPR